MASLPPSATSWDITSWSPARQFQASRALIRNQTLRSDRTGPTADHPLVPLRPAPVLARGVPEPFPAETAPAQTRVPRATLEPAEPPAAGDTRPGLPPA